LESSPDTVRALSVGFVRAERIPTDGIPDGFWPGAPDLAIDLVSPSDGFTYLLAKVVDFLTAGTPLSWVIDAEARKAVIFRPGKAPETVDADGELSGGDVVPGFVLRLADVWV
jgi:Uma2 family endonuclease